MRGTTPTPSGTLLVALLAACTPQSPHGASGTENAPVIEAEREGGGLIAQPSPTPPVVNSAPEPASAPTASSAPAPAVSAPLAERPAPSELTPALARGKCSGWDLLSTAGGDVRCYPFRCRGDRCLVSCDKTDDCAGSRGPGDFAEHGWPLQCLGSTCVPLPPEAVHGRHP